MQLATEVANISGLIDVSRKTKEKPQILWSKNHRHRSRSLHRI